MSQSQPKQNRALHWIIPGLLGVAVVVIGMMAAGFVYAANQETQDSFCASCHTQPETTYFQRSTSAQPVDLASFHTAKQTQCINCHSGPGIAGRLSAELLGARNAIKWYTGVAVQPAVLRYAIGDGNCIKCHNTITQRGFIPVENITPPGGGTFGSGEREEEGRANHWHEFLARWQAASPAAGSCIGCHSGHATGGSDQNGYMNDQSVRQVCDSCHSVLRRED